MELSSDQLAFLERCEEARRIAFSFKNPLIVHHYDADGISSGAVASGSFLKAGRKHRTKCIRTLDDAAIEALKGEKEIIFTDLGSGNKRVDEFQDVLVIDHHQPAGISKPQANCMQFNMDGGKELSAASTAYLVFREYVDLGIVGAVGDMQAPFQGLNEYVAQEGKLKGEVNIDRDLCFYGRFSRPLMTFLLYSDEIYIPTLSYREDRIADFLRQLGIQLKDGERWRTYSDLKDAEKQKLISALADILISYGAIKNPTNLIRESYTFPSHDKNETYEANEFSTLLNACGRNNRPDIGLGVCLGNEGAYKEASALLQLHRKNIREGISYAQMHVQDLGKYYFLDARGIIEDSIIGIICGMWLKFTSTKPIFGVSLGENGTLKISGRATGPLLKQGVNIGLMLRSATEKIGGTGGGHRIAGGATFPKDKINEFMLELGERLG